MDGNTPVHRKILSESNNYASSGKVMLISVIVCFTVAIIVVLLHFYYRYFTIQRRPSSVHRLENRSLTPKSLPRAVLEELPVLVYSTGHDSLECAICLTEFQDNQSGRVLPKCSHVFHLQCIDTWFLSHSDCPLCRAMVTGPGNKPGNSSGSYQDNSGSGTGETGGLTSSEHLV